MSLPVSYPSTTPRLGLPFLYPAQAQKEFFVNEALARIDAVIHPAVEGSALQPPAETMTGECWLVAPAATGSFTGHDNSLACFDGTQWSFIVPPPGTAVYDKATACIRRFSATWSEPAIIAAPSTGTIVDAEARQAIVALLQALEGLSLIKQG